MEMISSCQVTMSRCKAFMRRTLIMPRINCWPTTIFLLKVFLERQTHLAVVEEPLTWQIVDLSLTSIQMLIKIKPKRSLSVECITTLDKQLQSQETEILIEIKQVQPMKAHLKYQAKFKPQVSLINDKIMSIRCIIMSFPRKIEGINLIHRVRSSSINKILLNLNLGKESQAKENISNRVQAMFLSWTQEVI